jgi:hypothetical protein
VWPFTAVMKLVLLTQKPLCALCTALHLVSRVARSVMSMDGRPEFESLCHYGYLAGEGRLVTWGRCSRSVNLHQISASIICEHHDVLRHRPNLKLSLMSYRCLKWPASHGVCRLASHIA